MHGVLRTLMMRTTFLIVTQGWMEVWIDRWLFMSLVRGLRADRLTLLKLHSEGEKGAGGSDSLLYPKTRDTQVPGPSQQQLCLPIPGRTREWKTQHWNKE